jgi:hypothetical protein
MQTFFNSLSALSALVNVHFNGWFKRYRTRITRKPRMQTFFNSLSALSALVSVPFEVGSSVIGRG